MEAFGTEAVRVDPASERLDHNLPVLIYCLHKITSLEVSCVYLSAYIAYSVRLYAESRDVRQARFYDLATPHS